MKRLATYAWALSAGIVGFFVGMLFLGGYHTFDNWQVILAGFVAAIFLAVPTWIGVSRVVVTAAKPAVAWLTCAGSLVLAAMLFVYSAVAFH